MALSRNERRKLSKLRALERAKRVQRAADNAAHVERMAIIQRNLSNGVERNYLPNASCIAGFAGKLHAAKEYRNAQGVQRADKPANIAKPSQYLPSASWPIVEK